MNINDLGFPVKTFKNLTEISIIKTLITLPKNVPENIIKPPFFLHYFSCFEYFSQHLKYLLRV